MDIESLRHDVLLFRHALEARHHDLDETIFGSFPSGCCGAVSELLAVFLQVRGHGAFTYVCGLWFDSDFGSSTHAWLEQEGCIVDITQDQFDGRGSQAFVTADRSWHDSHFAQQEKQGPFTFDDLSSELFIAYAYVKEELEGESPPF
jgi:hypothetical protein